LRWRKRLREGDAGRHQYFNTSMKHILAFIAVFASIVTLGQNKFADFTRHKRFIELRTGICMKYIDTGKLSGPQLLLLHGYTDTSRSFQLLMENLSRVNKNLRILAPDLRGHGETSMPEAVLCQDDPKKCFTPKLFAEDVIDLMDQLCIDKIHVAGHSMGSIIAQELALNYPERIASITLIETFVDGSACETIQDFLIADLIETDYRCILEEKFKAKWPSDAYGVLPVNMGETITTYLRENWVVETAAAEDFLQVVFDETLKIPLGTWIGAIKSLAEIDYRSALETLKIPTLILWSTQDVVTSAKDQVLVKSAFQSAAKSNGTKVIYKTYGKLPVPPAGYPLNDLGHNLHWGAPKEVANDIYSFITNGYAINNLPYTNPSNTKEILTDETSRITELK
jgi:pimeloyl-ACP methyl ester carboxylesterase